VGQQSIENTIDLDHLPTTYDATWHHFSMSRFKKFNGEPLVFRAPLAIALLCDASAALETGRVLLASNKLSVKSSNTVAYVGNIDSTELPRFFSYALDCINDPATHILTNEPTGASSPLLVEFTPLAERLLLASSISGTEWINATLSPLSLDDIARNVDAFVLSVSKVQMVDKVKDIAPQFMFNGTGPIEVPGEKKKLKQRCDDPHSDF
jgi:hypothetical protein